MYTLIDYDYDAKNKNPKYVEKHLIKGRFYENEIQAAKFQVFKVEKVIKQQKRNGVDYVYVKWKGWPEKYNSWEPKENIVRTFENANSKF